MTEKIRKMLSLILALMLCVFVLAPSFAEETEEIPETELEEEFEEEEEVEEEEEIVSFDDDDCGSADEETVAQNAPKMTEEIIQEDDWSDVVKARNEAENERQAEVERQAQEEAKHLADEIADEAAEETAEEETVKESAEETTEEPAEETAEESAEEAAEEAAEETTEESADESAEEPTDEEMTEPEEAETEDEEEAEEDPDKITVKVEAAMVGENLMKLTAIVHGPEDRTYAFQWQMSEEKDRNYSDIEEATEQELLVELTEDNINSFWRVRVEAV